MTRPYSPYDTSSAERFGDDSPQPGQYDPDSSFRSRYRSSYDSYRSGDDGAAYEDYDAYAGDSHDDADDDIYEYYEPVDKRWMWVASVAGVILLVAVICTVIILGGGDSGSVSVTTTSPAAPTTSQSPTTPVQDATSKPVPPPPGPAMSPETVTTVTPSPRATAEPTAEPAPPAAAAPPAAEASPRTITYTVTGTRPLLDLVTIVYTDQQGALQTEFNVALPWTKSVTLNPGVELKSVTATSVTGQLNCAITDANGAVLVQQANNTMIATCTQ
ncbi:MmpS family transport accessory protein [Mycolicibacterium brisbanense]